MGSKRHFLRTALVFAVLTGAAVGSPAAARITTDRVALPLLARDADRARLLATSIVRAIADLGRDASMTANFAAIKRAVLVAGVRAEVALAALDQVQVSTPLSRAAQAALSREQSAIRMADRDDNLRIVWGMGEGGGGDSDGVNPVQFSIGGSDYMPK